MTSASLTHLQFGLLVVGGAMVSGLLHFTFLIYQEDTRGWWITVTLSVITVTTLAYAVAALLDRFPGQSLVGVGRQLYGRWLGGLLALPVLIILCSTVPVILRGLAELVARTLLPHTPMSTVLLVSCAGATYVALLRPEGMGRLGEIAMYLIMFPIVTPILVTSIGNVDLAYLQPWFWWPDGVPFSFNFVGSWTFFLGALTIVTLAPFLAVSGRARRPIVWSGAVSGVILLGLTALPLGSFGPEASKHLNVPLITFLNTVPTTFLFIQQLSYLTVALWTLEFLLSAALMLWACAHGLAEIVGWDDERLFTGIAATGAYLVGVQLVSSPLYLTLLKPWTVIAGGAYLWILLLYWPMAWWRRRPSRAES